MKKKFLSFMLALALVVTGATLLAGCGDPADVEVQIGKKKYQYEVLTEAIVADATNEVIKITLNKDMVLTETFHITNNLFYIIYS